MEEDILYYKDDADEILTSVVERSNNIFYIESEDKL